MRLSPFFEEDGEIGGITPEIASESSSVVTEGQETLGDGNAPTPADGDVQTTEDVTKQQSFAQRLKESTERAIAEERQKWEQEAEQIRQENAYLDKQAQIYGYRDRHEYKKAVDEHFRQQEIEAEARRMGLDPDVYAQHFAPVTQEVQQLRQELNTYKAQLTEKQQQEQAQAQWGALYNEYPHLLDDAKAFSEGKNPTFYNEQMQSYLAKGYEPKDAYELAHKETLFKAKEQEVLARVTGRDQRQVLSSTDQPNNLQFDPANMTSDDILKISERVQRGERITFK